MDKPRTQSGAFLYLKGPVIGNPRGIRSQNYTQGQGGYTIYPLISAEKLGELDGLSIKMISLIRHVRSEKVELHLLERERVRATGVAGQFVLDQIDLRLAELDTSRKVLLGRIARAMPGYDTALRWAQANMGFDDAVGTARYNKRREGCFTFGMPEQRAMAVWVQNGEVIHANAVDW